MAQRADTAHQLDLGYDPDQDMLLLTVGGQTWSFNSADVDRLLAGLGEVRASMKPERTTEFAEKSIRGITDPKWQTQPMPMSPDSLVHIRDPRFGWLSYVLPQASAARLGRFLVAQASTARNDIPMTMQ